MRTQSIRNDHKEQLPVHFLLRWENILAFACGLLFSVLLTSDFSEPRDTFAQETPPAEAAAETPTAAEEVAETVPVQRFDPKKGYGQLIFPRVADKLSLTDAQKLEVHRLLNERAQQLAAVEASDVAAQEKIQIESDKKLEALLTPEQKRLWTRVNQGDIVVIFNNHPWADALNWFAKQVGKQLDMPAPPPGGITYSSREGMTATEVLDEINSRLYINGYTLINGERTLTVFNLKRGGQIPMEYLPKVDESTVDERGRFEFVAYTLPLERRDQTAVLAQIQNFKGPYGRVISGLSGNTILLIDTVSNIKSMATIAKSVHNPPPPKRPDAPAPPPPAPKSVWGEYLIEKNDPEWVMETIKSFVNATGFRDPGGSTLYYLVPDNQHANIRTIIDMLERSEDERPAATLETYSMEGLTDTSPEVLYRKARMQAYGYIVDPAANFGTAIIDLIKKIAPNSHIAPNQVSNKVVVLAVPEEHEKIKELFSKLQSAPSPELIPVAKIYRSVDPGQILRVNPQLLKTIEKTVPSAQFSYDGERGELLVLGIPKDQEIVKQLLGEIQEQSLPDDEKMLAMYPVAAGQLNRFMMMFPQIKRHDPELRDVIELRDGRSNQLSLWASLRQHRKVKSILDQIAGTGFATLGVTGMLGTDAAPGEANTETTPGAAASSTLTQMKAIPLRNANSYSVQQVVMNMVPGIETMIDHRTNSLVVYGGAEAIQAVTQAVETMDNALDNSLVFVPLHVEPDQRLLDSFPVIAPRARPAFDKKNMRMMVYGPKNDVQKIQDILETLKAEQPESKETFRRYDMSRELPNEMLDFVRKTYPRAELQFNRESKRLIVIAPENELVDISKLVFEIEQSLPPEEVRKFYTLEEPITDHFLTLLKQSAESLGHVREIKKDEKNPKVLFVYAQPKIQEHIASVLENKDEYFPAIEPNRFHSFAITQDVRKRFDAARDDFVKQHGDFRILNEDRRDILSVYATQTQIEQLEALFVELGKEIAPELVEKQIFHSLKFADLNTVRTLLEDVYPGTKIMEDKPGGRIIVRVRPDYYEGAKALIERLDTRDPDQVRRYIKPYDIDGIHTYDGQGNYYTPRHFIIDLEKIVPGAKISFDRMSQRLIVLGTDEEHAIVEEYVGGLFKDGDSTSGVELFPLRRVDPSTMITMVERLYPYVRARYDRGTRSIVAEGGTHQLKLIKKLIDKLDPAEPGPTDPVVRFYKLNAKPDETILTPLKQLVPAANIVPDVEANQLMVIAKPDEHVIIEHNVKTILETFTQPEEPVLFIYSVAGDQRKYLENFIEATREKLPELKILPDSPPGKMHIRARPKEHEIISGALQMIQLNQGGELGLKLEPFPLTVLKTETAEAVIAKIHPEVQLIPDAQANRLLLYGTNENIAAAVETLKRIDTDVADLTQPKFKTFTLDGIRFQNIYARRMTIDRMTLDLQTLTPNAQFYAGSDYYSLIAWGTPQELQRISKAMEMIGYSDSDEERARPQVFDLKSVDASIVETILTPSFPDAQIRLDETSGKIVVFARAKDLKDIESFFEIMQRSSAENRETMTYDITGTTVDIAQEAISSAYPNLKITPDVRMNRLSIFAAPEEHVKIGEIVEQLNKEAAGAMVERFKAYAIPRSNYVTVTNMLKEMYPEAVAFGDAYSDKITVKARASEHEQIKELLESLQAKDDRFRTKFSVYPFGKTEPTLIESLLQSMLPMGRSLTAPEIRNQLRGLGRGGGGGYGGEFDRIEYNMQQSASMQIIREGRAFYRVDPNTSTAIVIATEEDQKQIGEAIQSLVEAAADAPEVKAKSFTLNDMSVYSIMQMLRQAAPTAQVFPSVNSDYSTPRSFVAYGLETELQKIDDIVTELNASGEGGNRRQLLVITMPPGTRYSRQQVIRMITGLYPPSGRGSTPVPGPEPNQIVLFHFEHLREQIQQAVDEVCKPVPDDQQCIYQTYTIENMPMTDAIRWLELIAPNATYEQKSTPERDIYTYAPLADKTLLVYATPIEHALIKKALQEIDRDVPPAQRRFSKVYSIHELGVSSYLPSLRELAPAAKFVRANYSDFVLHADLSDHEKVAQFVKEINDQGPSESRRTFNVLTIPPGTSYPRATLIQLIAAYFPQLAPQPGMEMNQITVYGSVYQKEQAQEILDKACVEIPETEKAEFKWYQVKHVHVLNAVQWLQQVVPNAVITMDSRTDWSAGVGILVKATPPELMLVEKTLSEIDVDVPEEIRPVMKTYDVSELPPNTFYDFYYAMRATIRDMIFIVPDATRLVYHVTARPETHENIAKLLKSTFDEQNVRNPKLEIYRLQRTSFLTVNPVLARLVSPTTQITQGPSPDVVHVYGIPREQQIIAEAIEKIELDALKREQDDDGFSPSMKVYHIASNTAYTVYPLFLHQFPSAIVYPTGTSELVVWASPDQHLQIQKMVDGVEEAYPERYLKPYFCKHVRPDEMLYLLQSLYAATPATITYRYSTGDIIVLASEEYHAKVAKSIEELDIPRPEDAERYAVEYDLSDFHTPYIRNNIITPILNLTPQVAIFPHIDKEQIVILARASEHERIEKVFEEMRKKNPLLKKTFRSYTVKTMTAVQALPLVQQIAPNAQVGYGTDIHELKILAGEADHQRITEAVAGIDHVDPNRSRPVAYRFQRALLASASQVIQAYFPTVTIVPDHSANFLLVTAVPEDHVKIRRVCEELDSEDPLTQTTLRVHRTGNVNMPRLIQALQVFYRLNPRVLFSPDYYNRTITVVGNTQQHEFVADLVKQIEGGALADPELTVKTYSLWNQNYYAVSMLIEDFFAEKGIKINMNFDSLSRNLIVFAKPQEHKIIEEILGAVRIPDRYMEVFTLDEVDPQTLQQAQYQLFSEEPFRPTIEWDYDTVFVRGTELQIDKIRALLIQLGERKLINKPKAMIKLGSGDDSAPKTLFNDAGSNTHLPNVGADLENLSGFPAGQTPSEPVEVPQTGGVISGSEGMMRTFKIQGDTTKVLEELQREMQKKGVTLHIQEQSKPFIQEKPQEENETPKQDEPSDEGALIFTRDDFRFASSDHGAATVFFQAPIERPASEEEETPVKPPQVSLIVNHDGTVTLISLDTGKLDAIEKEIQNIVEPTLESRIVLSGRDFTVYSVRNVSTAVVIRRLQIIFAHKLPQQAAGAGGNRYTRPSSGYGYGYGMTRRQTLSITPEPTMNGIMVRGSKREREEVGREIMKLDQSQLGGEGLPKEPINVRLEYGTKTEILQQVLEVFTTQIRTTQLPDGSFPRVLPNRTNNSIDIYAPEPLASHIKQYAEKLDQQVVTQQLDKIHVIRPETASSRVIEDAIRQLQMSSMRKYQLANPYYVQPYASPGYYGR